MSKLFRRFKKKFKKSDDTESILKKPVKNYFSTSKTNHNLKKSKRSEKELSEKEVDVFPKPNQSSLSKTDNIFPELEHFEDVVATNEDVLYSTPVVPVATVICESLNVDESTKTLLQLSKEAPVNIINNFDMESVISKTFEKQRGFSIENKSP